MRWAVALTLSSSLAAFSLSGIAGAPSDKNEKPKPQGTQDIDSGSFGVFIKGQRVATETFSVEQRSGTSIIKSTLKEIGPPDPVSQKSDLEISGSGELLRYEWNQSNGGSLTVLPNNDFLLEKISTATSTKPAEQSFLLGSTTNILDNNFFVHREVLAWHFLVAACKPEGGGWKCQQGPAEFGALVPQDRVSMPVRMEVIGKEKVTIRGAEHNLLRLNLSGEAFEWSLWVDDQDHFKLMRVTIPADNTEVIRD
jgi:hypothetical protein